MTTSIHAAASPASFLNAVAELVRSSALSDALARLARRVHGTLSFGEARRASAKWRAHNTPSGAVAREALSVEFCARSPEEAAEALEARYAWVIHCESLATQSRRAAKSGRLPERPSPYAVDELLSLVTGTGRPLGRGLWS